MGQTWELNFSLTQFVLGSVMTGAVFIFYTALVMTHYTGPVLPVSELSDPEHFLLRRSYTKLKSLALAQSLFCLVLNNDMLYCKCLCQKIKLMR